MTSKEHISINNKESNNKENVINLADSDSKKIEDIKHRNSSMKNKQEKEKEKSRIKTSIIKKLNNEIEIVEETKNYKVKDLMDNNFINEYDPEMQDNVKYPKLNFFIDCGSCSESEQDLSSPSISEESAENKKENSKDIYKNTDK